MGQYLRAQRHVSALCNLRPDCHRNYFFHKLDKNFGIINVMLRDLGIISKNIDWLHNPAISKPLVAFITNWRYIGYVAVIYLSGLQGISSEIYDAGKG